MTCTNCAAENEPGRKFCGNCGQRLAAPCPTCGTANPPGTRFCGECGNALAETDAPPAAAAAAATAPTSATERRLVSVL
ncbi:MAG: zinc ribbon domain-containing protein, partial [Chloroflexi bacterium]|nr:zinc ribbon domain-containing protein [Chloroflexota bacterium]